MMTVIILRKCVKYVNINVVCTKKSSLKFINGTFYATTAVVMQGLFSFPLFLHLQACCTNSIRVSVMYAASYRIPFTSGYRILSLIGHNSD